MPAAHPKEFRDDVVAVARRGEAPIAKVAKGFGISESCLRNWLKIVDVEDGEDRAPSSPTTRSRWAAPQPGSLCGLSPTDPPAQLGSSCPPN